MKKTKDFLRTRVEDDLASGKYETIITRFPPEPNGFPHIGHAKSIYINFGIAHDYNGRCNLRMDDTNPTTEDPRYVEALKDAVTWLGYRWDGDVRYTSDYFDRLYDYAVELIGMGKAYIDSVDEETMRLNRGTVTEAGVRSAYAERSIVENLDLFARMKAGEFADGEHVLRARIDMAAANMKMRDPLLYRIRNVAHYRAGDAWHIYPMYDFAHCLSDYIEGVTHSICTLEFENNRDVYDWIIDALGLEPPRPYQYEFARLSINYTIMSKRKLLELVDTHKVSGWDDPRLPTIAGLRRRGYTPEAVRKFCEQIGISKANSTVDVSQLEFAIRDDLNPKVPRVMCVLDPLKVTITNYEGSEEIDAPYYPHDVPKEGSRKLPFSREIYIDRGDFSEHPPQGYYRLTPNQPVRLKHAYIITCDEVIHDASGNITEIKAHYHPDSRSGADTSGIRVKSAIQWVDAIASRPIEVRLYDRLYASEVPQSMDDLNPDSLRVISGALIEPAVIAEKPDVRFQFEREGYFYRDPIDSMDTKPIFNRIVTLKDSWSKKRQTPTQPSKPQPKKEQVDGEVTPMNREEEARFNHYTDSLGLGSEVANTLARDSKLASFFETALGEVVAATERAKITANIVANDVARHIKLSEGAPLLLTPTHVAQLARMVEEATISSKIAKEIFEVMAAQGRDPEQIVAEKGLRQISDPAEIIPIIDAVIAAHPDNLAKYHGGNTRLLGFFVGQVLKATGGKANPKVVNQLVQERLG